MIAKLRGLLDQTGDGWAIIDCNGVGYLISCSARTLRVLPAIGTEITLFIHTDVREDAINLHGFADPAERDWFRLLTRVQGVGARLALSILGLLAPNPLADAILRQDKACLMQAEGVGAKLATRILTELKDKTINLARGGNSTSSASASGAAFPTVSSEPGDRSAADEALSALLNLGFQRQEAQTALAAAHRDLGPAASLDALVRAGLQALTPFPST